MLRLTNLSNKYNRRTLRALYGQTQAYPYDVQLSAAQSRTGQAIEGTATTGITGSKSAILPGLVATKIAGEVVKVSGNAAAGQAQDDGRPFGLFANFVGGEISDIPSDFDRVGVWRGVGGVFEILAPAFDDTGLSTLATAEDGASANEVYFKSNAKGQLLGAGGTYDAAAAATGPAAARLLTRLSSSAVVVELLV